MTHPRAMSGEELAEVRKRPTQTEVEARLLAHIDSLSAPTSGMTRQAAMDFLAAENFPVGDPLTYKAVNAILTATSQLSQGNGAEEMRLACVEAIPTNWLDPLLTGPTAVLPKDGRYSPREVEKLLLALRERLSALPIPPAAKGEVTEEEVKEAAQEYDLAHRNYSHREAMRKALLAARKVRG